MLEIPSFKLKRQTKTNQKLYLRNKRLDYRDTETKRKIVINCVNKDINTFPINKTSKVLIKNGEILEKNSNHKHNYIKPLEENYNFFESPIIINNKTKVNLFYLVSNKIIA